ncbi:MAG: hypothetical protein ACAF41_12040 [Leptolyngbya sp. BL-A-14]
MNQLRAFGAVLPLLLTVALHEPSFASQMSSTTKATTSGQNTMVTSTRLRGQVISFTKTTLTLKLANGKQKTFQVTPRQMGQLKLRKGQTVAVVAKGSKAEAVSTH